MIVLYYLLHLYFLLDFRFPIYTLAYIKIHVVKYDYNVNKGFYWFEDKAMVKHGKYM